MINDDKKLKELLRNADQNVNVDAAKLSEQVFVRKRRREVVAVRLLAGSCGVLLFGLTIGLADWTSNVQSEVAQSVTTKKQEPELKTVEFESSTEEFKNEPDSEWMEKRLVELKAELQSLYAEQNAQHLIFLKEKISRTIGTESSVDFTGMTEILWELNR